MAVAGLRIKAVALLLALASFVYAGSQPYSSRAPVTVIPNIVYSTPNGSPQRLDLYLPAGAEGPVPVVVWVHGGGWVAGSKDRTHASRLAERGYAVASINYRLAQEAVFPAQIEDCKAAVRWLRANAEKYGLDPTRIGAWGSSAGGHLVALMGTSGGMSKLEGKGGNKEYPSRVQAVCDWYGPADFIAWYEMFGLTGGNNPVTKLIGGSFEEKRDTAILASPTTHVTVDDPPFLIMHGDLDPVVPLSQSLILRDDLKAVGVEVKLKVVRGAGHGGSQFQSRQNQKLVDDFFDLHLMRRLLINANTASKTNLEKLYSGLAAKADSSGFITEFRKLTGVRDKDLSGVDLLVLADPAFTLNSADRKALKKFLQGGGGLLVVGTETSDLANLNGFVKKYQLSFANVAAGAGVISVPAGSLLSGPVDASVVSAGDKVVTINTDSGAEASILLGDGRAICAVSLDKSKLDKGRLIVLGDVDLLGDEKLDEADNRSLAGNILTWLRGGYEFAAVKASFSGNKVQAGGTLSAAAKITNLGYASSEPVDTSSSG